MFVRYECKGGKGYPCSLYEGEPIQYRERYLQGSAQGPLPEVVSIDEKNNSVTFRYKSEEFTLILGLPEKEDLNADPTSRPLLFIKSLFITVSFQGWRCFERWPDWVVKDLVSFLSYLKIFITFINDVGHFEFGVALYQEAVFRKDERKIRFYAKNPTREGTRFQYDIRTKQIEPLDVIFNENFLTSETHECSPYIQRKRKKWWEGQVQGRDLKEQK